jgi:transposase-like protein
MSRKPRVQRSPEEKWQIVLEGLKSGNIAETCRKYEIAPNLYYRWKDEVEAGAKAALGGRSAAARPDAEQEKRIKQLERALGRSHLQIEILKNVLGELVIDCCPREIIGWDLSLRCRTEDRFNACWTPSRSARSSVGGNDPGANHC